MGSEAVTAITVLVAAVAAGVWRVTTYILERYRENRAADQKRIKALEDWRAAQASPRDQSI